MTLLTFISIIDRLRQPETIAVKNDNKHHLQLSQTLFTYLTCFGDVIQTANRLNLHKNTLYYRLNQIKDFLNNDLSDGETNYQYMFSFHVLQYLGYFYPVKG